jgi:hypothetical protein
MKKLALVLCLLALAVPADASAPARSPGLPWWTQRPCPVEDAANCYWDAGAANGTGHSFMVRQFPDGGPVCLMYVERRYARHHDRCLSEP